MILCLCRGVGERDIHAAIAGGASSLEDVAAACAAGSDCGACHASILELLAPGRCPLDTLRGRPLVLAT